MKYLFCVLFGWLMVGCIPAGSTMVGPAYVHPTFPYAVTYDDEHEKSVLGKEWDLETYRKKDGVAGDAPVELERKDGYEAVYKFDFNDDDKSDASAKLPMPDLVFVNRHTSARIEVTTLLLDKKLADKELRVLLSDVVDGNSGTRSLFVGFGRAAVGVEKRYASKLLDAEEATLGSQKGMVATIERVDLDQLEANPKATWRRTRLLLVHAPFEYNVAESGPVVTGSATSGSNSASSDTYHPYRVLLLVEYSNDAVDFEQQYPEFLRLLGKLHLMDDERLLSYLGTQIERCSNAHAKASSLTLGISPLGVPSVDDSKGFDPLCLPGAIDGYRFAATGKQHSVSATFDLSKPLPKPDWLSKSDYSEQRPTTPDAAPAPASAPDSTTPPPAAPATPPADAAPQPAGGASSSSSENSAESGSSSKP